MNVLQGIIEHGQGKGHLAGFPTANLKTVDSPLPKYGVYASVMAAQCGTLHWGVTNVGTRPTADQRECPTVETWLPGYEGDLYGQKATVILLDFLREIRRFGDMSELKRQIDLDVETAQPIGRRFMAHSMVSRSAEETRKAGCSMAGRFCAGDVLTLTGPLGAGKSEFVRGIAGGLGITGPIPSPTFTILNMYDTGRIPLYHYDWYRVEDPEELVVIGAEEHLPGDGLTVIEWSEQAPELLPDMRLDVTLIPIGDTERIISLEPHGGFRNVEEWITELKKTC